MLLSARVIRFPPGTPRCPARVGRRWLACLLLLGGSIDPSRAAQGAPPDRVTLTGTLGDPQGAPVEDARHLSTDGNADLAVPDRKRDDSAVSADAGAVCRPVDGLALVANVGRAWRAPTYFDLFANGPRIGEQRWLLGDPDLSTETSLNVDGGVRWRRGRVRAEASFYRNRIDDHIYSEARGDSAGGFPVFVSRQADATLTVGELGVEVQALPALLLRARGEFVRGTNEATDDPLPLIPPRRAVLGGRDLRADLRVSNVLDKNYRDFLSRYKAFASEPGRNILHQLSLGL